MMVDMTDSCGPGSLRNLRFGGPANTTELLLTKMFDVKNKYFEVHEESSGSTGDSGRNLAPKRGSRGTVIRARVPICDSFAAPFPFKVVSFFE